MTLRKLSIIGLFGLFTQSWAADLPAHGTWVGTIGQYPITMCLATDDKGTYRYQGHSGEINLIRMQSDWVEVVNGAVTGRWVLANSAPSELNGSWESGNGTTTLPIALTLSNSGATACGNADSTDDAPEPPLKPYAIINWKDGLNPRFVNLGEDNLIVSTSTGTQLWNARKNTFSTPENWPDHSEPGYDGVKLGNGRMIIAVTTDPKLPFTGLLWWNEDTRRFSAPAIVSSGMTIYKLVPIDTEHALVCGRTTNRNGTDSGSANKEYG